MQIIYEYDGVSASDRLEGLAQEKLEELKKRYEFVHRADVFFKQENRTDDQEMVCDIRLSLPGPRLFASTKDTTFAAALKETVRDLTDQLKKTKEKMGAR